MKKFFNTNYAFTLAEVLITLGIIGVVASLTLPSLIQHHKKQEASARLKKFYSMMDQAVMLSTIDNGHPNTWFRTPEDKSPDKETADKMLINGNSAYTFFMKYLAPYMKYVSIDKFEKTENPEDMKKFEVMVVLADSSTIYLHNGDCLDMAFDYNGAKLPNKAGRDRFEFMLCNTAYYAKVYNGNKNIVFSAFVKEYAPTRQKALEKCKTNTYYCSTLLLYDNWEFKDDYPWKL